MTDDHRPSAPEESASPGDEQASTKGCYLYCLVDTTSAEPDALSAMGVGDNPVYVVESGSVGAVVHDCETVYDTDDTEQVKQWLLTHQHVVDVAGDVFGTPLPVRFDTVFKGGEAGVERWLREHRDRVRGEMTTFAGTWEYRIHLFWDPATVEDRVVARDDRLQEIRQRQQEAGAGERFLLAKQYDKRLEKLKRERRADLTESLQEMVTPLVNELTVQEPNSRFSLDENPSAADNMQVTRLAVLADEERESDLGDRLDEIVEREGIEIRFTGPWPPYTFAPDFG